MKLNRLLIGMIIILLGTVMYFHHNMIQQQKQTLEVIDQKIKLQQIIYKLHIENYDLKYKPRTEKLQKEYDSIIKK